MKIVSITDNRKKLVKALEEATGLTAKYCGAPSFGYEVGPYTVDRAGGITVEEPDPEVLDFLCARGLVMRPEDTNQDDTGTIVSLPMADHDGRSLKNLVFLLNSKSVLLSKAVGRPGVYKVSEELIKALDEKAPQSTEDFLQILVEAEDGSLKGLTFEDGKIGFLFPYTMEPDKLTAYMQLTELMAKMAREQKRVQPTKCKDTNEKYTFRTWLLRLGMVGDEYKTARKILLKNLKGHTAFRTKDQAEVAKEKLKAQREAERETAAEMAFEEL